MYTNNSFLNKILNYVRLGPLRFFFRGRRVSFEFIITDCSVPGGNVVIDLIAIFVVRIRP